VKHIAFFYTVASEPVGIRIIPDLQHISPDISRVGGQKSLDVMSINGKTPVEAKRSADGRQPPKTSKAHPTHPWPPRVSSENSARDPEENAIRHPESESAKTSGVGLPECEHCSHCLSPFTVG
jgi:hypothetical protein